MPELLHKLRILADAAKYDASCASSGSARSTPAGGIGNGASVGICHSYTPDGRCVSLLKLLLTNACIYDCLYCVNRVSSDVPRARFTPAEVAQLTLDFYRRNLIEGLFLSSGVLRDPDYTMEQVIEVARLLREEHRFGGYIHLKVVPGASPELLARAGRLADRLSANVELPTTADLDRLAPEKKLPEIEETMSRIRAGREELPRFAPAGQSTQMVVGASAAPDAEILGTAAGLYRRHKLKRVYYSAYSPIPHADPRLPPAAPPLLREHRLYQADWLLRFYGFTVAELLDGPSLDLSLDPKLAWALRNRASFPVDLNAAPRERLLRVPGLGRRTVQAILGMRRHRRLRLDDLARLRVPLGRARHFLVTADYRPRDLDRLDLNRRLPQQLDLFEARQVSIRGEL